VRRTGPAPSTEETPTRDDEERGETRRDSQGEDPAEVLRRPGPGVRSTLGVTKPTRRRQKETPVEQQTQYVGIDLHRRRSVIVRRTGAGETLVVRK